MEIANLVCGAHYRMGGRIVLFEESREEREDTAGFPVFVFTAMDDGEQIQMSTDMVRAKIGPRVNYVHRQVSRPAPRAYVVAHQ